MTIPLGTRVAVDVMETLDRVTGEQGISQRAAIKSAIREYWGKQP